MSEMIYLKVLCNTPAKNKSGEMKQEKQETDGS